jgi:hypothetical protein
MTNRRDGNEYERIVAVLGKALFETAENSGNFLVKYGGSNKWIGVSGYNHQIDVSAQSNETILLIECKNWGSNVGVPSFLTFLARVIDIRSNFPDKKVIGKIVTTIGFDRGVKMLASYYEIELDKVKNENEFLLRFQQYGIGGVADQGKGTDSVRVSRTCSVCGSVLVKEPKGSTYICPTCS